MSAFPDISPIQYEGPDSTNPLAPPPGCRLPEANGVKLLLGSKVYRCGSAGVRRKLRPLGEYWLVVKQDSLAFHGSLLRE